MALEHNRYDILLTSNGPLCSRACVSGFRNIKLKELSRTIYIAIPKSATNTITASMHLLLPYNARVLDN